MEAVINKYQAIGLPKFRRNEDLQRRIEFYQNFLNHALELVSCESFVLALHPGELKYSEKIKGKRFREVQIYSPPPSNHPMEDYFRLLSHSRLVLSDYLGAHTFRSSLFFDSEVHLTSDLWRNPIEESKIRELFDAYIVESSRKNRRLISQEVLGVDFFKSTSEIREILGFGKLKKSCGPAIKAAYSFRTSK